jgi:hypothetical protein
LRLHDERHEKHENAIHAVDVADAGHVPDAEYAATATPISINVVAGHGDGLPFDDASFERLVARKPNTP